MDNNKGGEKPFQSILKRIDISLVIGIIAVFVSFLSVLAAKKEVEVAQDVQKALSLPLIQIDMGYQYQTAPYSFKITLTNSGPGIAYVQNVQPLINGKPVADYKKLQEATMIGRMLGSAKLKESAAAGYISAGDSVTPWQFEWGKGGLGDINAYLRGAYGAPMKDVDLEACYCSIFNECWTVRLSDHRKPTPVESCGPDDVQDDFFQKAVEMRAADRLDNK